MAIKPPRCPAPSAAAVDEFETYLPAGHTPSWRWLEDLGRYCDKIDEMRRGG